MKNSTAVKHQVIRLIDANLNRAKEAARVCEEVARFVIEDEKLSMSFKRLRHSITEKAAFLNSDFGNLLSSRSVETDVGLRSTVSEDTRRDINDVFFANIQRLKESVRVLEEFSKIINKTKALNFKKIRFQVYALEKKTAEKLLSVCDN